jgi:DmsE family decaheme c-type cytochrome
VQKPARPVTRKSITTGRKRRTGRRPSTPKAVHPTKVAKIATVPGADHVAGGGDKTKIFVFEGKSRQETSARCLSCHGEAHEQSHFAQSAHSSSNIGCIDCHSPHHAQEKEFLLVQEQPKLCYGCHVSAKADFAKPYHHRVNEGLVLCSDCHNPHGTGIVRQVRSLPSGDFICYKCHADKQVPSSMNTCP